MSRKKKDIIDFLFYIEAHETQSKPPAGEKAVWHLRLQHQVFILTKLAKCTRQWMIPALLTMLGHSYLKKALSFKKKITC